MNLFNIERAFLDKKERKWNKLYWAIDLHDTLITGKYNRYNHGSTIYPGAEDVMHWIMHREDMVSILYTSSHDDAIRLILPHLKYTHGIIFDYINKNPECGNTELCNFAEKFYFNILLDDKAGFDGNTDWLLIKEELIRIGEWE